MIGTSCCHWWHLNTLSHFILSTFSYFCMVILGGLRNNWCCMLDMIKHLKAIQLLHIQHIYIYIYTGEWVLLVRLIASSWESITNGTHQFGYDKKNDPNNSMNGNQFFVHSNFKKSSSFPNKQNPTCRWLTSLPPNWLHKHNVAKGKKEVEDIIWNSKKVGTSFLSLKPVIKTFRAIIVKFFYKNIIKF